MVTQQIPQTRNGLLPEARHVVLPDGITTTAFPAVKATCAEIGIGFDSWQTDLNKCILAKDATGLYAADTIVISIPRQVGKTYDIGALVFADCIINPGTTTVWTAHRFKVSRETFDALRALARSPLLSPHIDYDSITTAAGNECIPFRNGSRIVFAARERGAIRGFSNVRRLILDEAQILSESALADMVPTMNQAENPQIILMGTPPKPTDTGEVFTNLRTEALAGISAGVVYVEFSAPPDSKPDDLEALRIANPSYPKRTPLKAIQRMRKLLGAADFLREGLGIWDEADTHEHPISIKQWADLAIPDDETPTDPPARFALAMSPERIASIAAAVPGALADYLDLAEMSRVDDSRKLIDWLVERCGRRIVVMIDSRDPAASLINELRARGVKVNATTASDMGKACVGLVGGVAESRIQHCDQPAIRTALATAKKKPVGKAGLWEWDLEDLTPEMAALRALTLAHYGLSFKKIKKKTKVVVMG